MKPGKPIIIDKFKGTNLKSGVQSVIVNMDNTREQNLVIRKGRSLFAPLTNPHSLFAADDFLLAVANGVANAESLWKILPDGTKSELASIPSRSIRHYYLNILGKIYISSKVWNGIYDTEVIRAWGSSYSDDPSTLGNIMDSTNMVSLNICPAPFMENLCFAAGRIWGSVKNKLFYSLVHGFEMFSPTNYMMFPDDITIVASVDNKAYVGQVTLFVATTASTWMLAGGDPLLSEWSEVSKYGGVPESLCYGSFGSLGDSIPIWTNYDGVVAGTVEKGLLNLTKSRLGFDVVGSGPSFFRTVNGDPQYGVSFKLPSDTEMKFGDSVTAEVFRNGQII